jgi:hypothetical protein
MLSVIRLLGACLMIAAAALPRAQIAAMHDIDGRRWTPLSPPPGEINLLFFVTVDCPISNRYAPEIAEIAKAYAPRGVRTLLVYTDRSLDSGRVREHLQAFYPDGGSPGPKTGGSMAKPGTAISAILDADHALVSAVEPRVTPEAAIYAPAGRVYRGRIDDLYRAIGQVRQEPTRRDVRLALDAVLSGRRVDMAETQAVGCYIQRH